MYYARVGKKLLLILVGGDKRKQQAEIETAVETGEAYLAAAKFSG